MSNGLTTETLERLRAQAEWRTPGPRSGLKVARHELIALLDRVQQVEAERDELGNSYGHAVDELQVQQDRSLSLLRERDALRAKLDRVRELLEPAQHYMHSRLVSQALEVLNGR